MIRVNAVVLAAGMGRRFKAKTSKALIKINSCPLIIYCLKVLSSHPYIKDIVVVVNPLNREGISDEIKKYKIRGIKGIVLGGSRRQDSVFCGLEAVGRGSELVLIHDGARPFIDKKTLSAVIREASEYGAAITALPVTATIKEVHRDRFVKKTLKREALWEIQTPQVFKADLLFEAYRKFGHTEVTDDSSLVEKSGAKVRVVMGSYSNIKVTTPGDLILAETIARLKT